MQMRCRVWPAHALSHRWRLKSISVGCVIRDWTTVLVCFFHKACETVTKVTLAEAYDTLDRKLGKITVAERYPQPQGPRFTCQIHQASRKILKQSQGGYKEFLNNLIELFWLGLRPSLNSQYKFMYRHIYIYRCMLVQNQCAVSI